MVKIFGAVMTGFACAYMGLRMSTALKIRLRSLLDITASLEMLESEINFSVNKLKRAFMSADRNGLFTAAAEEMEESGIKTAWKNAVNREGARLCLTEADKETLLILGDKIGKTDTDDQIKNIRYVKSMVRGQAEQAQEEYKRFGRLYRGGGILVGLMIVIILL